MPEFSKGRYRVRLAAGDGDIAALRQLRHRAFRGGEGLDADAFDALCRHVMVEAGDRLLATCRVQSIGAAAGFCASYSAQYYDLAGFSRMGGPFLEIGRFCAEAGPGEAADVLRLIWAALTRIVDAEGVRVMFGCSSFAGCDPARHGAALALLAERHLGPVGLRPRAKAEAVPLVPSAVGAVGGAAMLPPLLRTYLLMGGWVGEDAVIDRDLDTLHVFTAIRVADIPPARARLLRMDAA